MKTIPTILIILFSLMGLTACEPTAVPPDNTLPAAVQQALAEQDGAYVILTLAGMLDEALAGQLETAGIRLFDPLGEYRFQAYVPQTAVPALAAWQTDQTIVSVEAIDPASKINGVFTDPARRYAIVVHFYAEPAAGETAVLAEQMVVERTAVGVMNFAEGQATGAQIEALSTLPFVKGIEEAVVSTGG
jgi:hypothetical protein